MKILIIMDPGILVPPQGYGGHERLVYMFARDYQRLGHEVELLVTEGSEIEGCVVHNFGKVGFPPNKWDARIAIPVAWMFLWKNRNRFDLIHNFGRLAYLIPILNHPIKKIMSYGRIISKRNIKIINKFPNKNLVFTAPSDWCVSTGNVAGNWKTIFNAIDFEKYNLQTDLPKNAPLIFLSRLERLKGAHIAIAIALSLNEKLIIAGNISELPEEKKYFENEIKPFIDNNQIKYVGVVNDQEKDFYLGQSKAMLFPARTDEAFGMVMVEAMACGTPVIAYNHAAMPEVIDDNVTGFIINNENEMIDAIKKIGLLNRSKCRERAESKYDVKILSKKYLNL